MSEYGDKYRTQAKKDKVKRYTRDTDGKVDASGYEAPGDPLAMMKPTYVNMPSPVEGRPKSDNPKPRKFKRGGKVEGEKAVCHSGRKHRAMGGQMAPGMAANNMPVVPATRFNFNPNVNRVGAAIGAMGVKRGGKVSIDKMGSEKPGSEAEAKKWIEESSGTRPTGDRIARKEGGRTKGKTNINIIISAGPKGEPQGGAGGPNAGPVRPPMPPPSLSAPMQAPPMGGMPPGGMPQPGMMPPSGMPPGMPPHPGMMPPPNPLGRKSGGRAYPIEDGAGGGEGRLEKIKAYGGGE